MLCKFLIKMIITDSINVSTFLIKTIITDSINVVYVLNKNDYNRFY